MPAILATPQLTRQLLPIGCLLTLGGGYLDAYAWLAHGHVFANAQTGNVVYIGLYAAAGRWAQAIEHLVPVVAFMVGVLAAKLLGVQAVKHTFHATLLCQGCELAVLFGLFVLQARIPDAWFVPAIALVAALQITSFGALAPLTFNSAMSTSNLLNALTGVFAWLHNGDPEGRYRAEVYSCIFTSFATGAFVGALYTQRNSTNALLPCIAITFAALILTWRQHLKYLRSKSLHPLACRSKLTDM